MSPSIIFIQFLPELWVDGLVSVGQDVVVPQAEDVGLELNVEPGLALHPGGDGALLHLLVGTGSNLSSKQINFIKPNSVMQRCYVSAFYLFQ